jgi:hypothetical protein
MERGVKMAAQAPRIGMFGDWRIHGFTDAVDQIRAKPCAQSRNLFWQKDGQGPALFVRKFGVSIYSK